MNARTQGIFAIVAALLVLMSAMWDARIPAGIAVVALAALGLYSLVQKAK
jgi:hypothetical protein